MRAAHEVVFSVADIARVTSGTVLREGPTAVGIAVEGADVRPGAAFVPVKATAYDLARRVAEAALAGAGAYVLERPLSCPRGSGVVLVQNTADALAALAREHRRRWPGHSLIGVTGSSGKSSTARLIAGLLQVTAGATLLAGVGHPDSVDPRNALACELLGLRAAHRHAVFELATRRRGDVARLAAMCEPDVGLVTLIGTAHAEGVGSLDDVADEKGELLEAVPRDGLVAFNHDDVRACAVVGRSHARRRVSWGYEPGADYRVRARTPLGLDGSRILLATPHAQLEVHTPAIGRSGALSVAAAVATVETLVDRALTQDEVQVALDRAALTREPRLVAAQLAQGTIVLEDRTDATPSSLRAALEAAAELARSKATRLVVVLGEMRELGRLAATEHGAVGARAAALGVAALVTVGAATRSAASEALARGIESWTVTDVPGGIQRALRVVQPGDVVLVAGGAALGISAIAGAIVARDLARADVPRLQLDSSRVDTP